METEHFQNQVKALFELIGFNEPSLDFDIENRKINAFVNEGPWLEKWLPRIVNDLEHIVRLVAKKHDQKHFYVDLNNYRKERERLIVELAKAAARKATTVKGEVRLPAMNAYERRLVHVELAVHPTVKTESTGEGATRCVVVKPIS